MTRRFQRTIESFVCEHCGASVQGNGYTNHCPECLWSKHVDVQPGDRAEECLGLMEPIRVTARKDEYVLTHVCTRCKLTRTVRSDQGDNFESLIAIVKASVEDRPKKN